MYILNVLVAKPPSWNSDCTVTMKRLLCTNKPHVLEVDFEVFNFATLDFEHTAIGFSFFSLQFLSQITFLVYICSNK